MAIVIGRPIEGVSINGLEFLLTEDGSTEREFGSVAEAKQFLRDAGETLSDEEMEDCYMFLDTETDLVRVGAE